MKKFLVLVASFLGALFIVMGLPALMNRSVAVYSGRDSETSAVSQSILRIDSEPHTVQKIYNAGQLIGVLSSQNRLNAYLKQVYADDYAETFPDSSVALGKDVYVEEEQSYFVYQNVDDDIFSYLHDNELFSLAATVVDFSDDSGVYAEIAVANADLYQQAMQDFLSMFISQSDLAALSAGQSTGELTAYGSRATGISISQTITTRDDYASPSDIKTTKEEILDYLEYGDNQDREYYTVERYDTVAGVGSKNNGLSATQVMNLNRDKISNVNQVLNEGEVLCVTYFTSPIDVVVTQESMRQETIYPSTIYQEDDTVREGESFVKQAGVNGSQNTVYSERWINGVLISGEKISSVETLQPVDEIITVGTLEIPGYGTGIWRWPVDNVHISCAWGCYANHEADDIQNFYDRYGPIYAADRGVIEENSYDPISGNYVIINHNDGWYSYYGHMYVPSPLAVGTIVDKGDVIGQIGMTGRATGPHVHFFIFQKDENGNRELHDTCEFLDCDATI